MQLGMIGLGRMGGNMTKRLAGDGHDVKTYDPGVESTASSLAELRDMARAGGHLRTAQNIASLELGWEQWLLYAEQAGVIDGYERDQLWQRVWKALYDLGTDQARYQRDASPADAYLRALGSLLTSGGAYLAALSGDGPPPGADRWGWRTRQADGPLGITSSTDPRGECIGWTDGAEVYLDPENAYRAARRAAEAAGAPLGVTKYALQQQLNARNLLATTEGQSRLTVRRSAGGRVRNVLHLNAAVFDAAE